MNDTLDDSLDLAFEVEMKSPRALAPHPENYREHPPNQIREIQASIRQHGIYKNIVVARDYTILAGHGVVEAVSQMDEIDQVPVYVLNADPDSAAAKKVIIADNETPKQAKDDEEQLADLLRQIYATEESSGGGLEGTGFDEDMMNDILGEFDDDDTPDEEKYTNRIDTPTYEVTGEEPDVEDLYDQEKTQALIAEIKQADLPTDLQAFLISAAQRHTRFDFEAIAEFYAHASPEVQALMEQSALVIIDFDQAIEQGFVSLSKNLQQIAEADDEATSE